VSPIGSRSDARREHGVPFVGLHPPHELEELVVGEVAPRVEHGGGDLQLAFGVMVNQIDFFARLRLDVTGELRGQILRRESETRKGVAVKFEGLYNDNLLALEKFIKSKRRN
jgi:hypothetical protein